MVKCVLSSDDLDAVKKMLNDRCRPQLRGYLINTLIAAAAFVFLLCLTAITLIKTGSKDGMPQIIVLSILFVIVFTLIKVMHYRSIVYYQRMIAANEFTAYSALLEDKSEYQPSSKSAVQYKFKFAGITVNALDGDVYDVTNIGDEIIAVIFGTKRQRGFGIPVSRLKHL